MVNTNLKKENKNINRYKLKQINMKKKCCARCSSIMEQIVTSYSFKNNRVLINGVRAFHCNTCGNEVINSDEAEKVFEVLNKFPEDSKKQSKINQVIAML